MLVFLVAAIILGIVGIVGYLIHRRNLTKIWNPNTPLIMELQEYNWNGPRGNENYCYSIINQNSVVDKDGKELLTIWQPPNMPEDQLQGYSADQDDPYIDGIVVRDEANPNKLKIIWLLPNDKQIVFYSLPQDDVQVKCYGD